MYIQAAPALLDEFEQELNALSIENSRSFLVANSADAGAYNIISVAIGASLTLIAQAIVAYLNKKRGQRKVVIQIVDNNDMLRRIEVEPPRLEEVDDLLKKATNIFIVEEEKKD